MSQKFTVDDFQVCSTQLGSRAPGESSAVTTHCSSPRIPGGRQAARAPSEAIIVLGSGNAVSRK
jgi:hypothetical protein